MPVLASLGPSPTHPYLPIASAPGELSAAARKYGVTTMPPLEWNALVERETAHLYERVRAVVPPVEWPFFAPYVKAINDLKRERGADPSVQIIAHPECPPDVLDAADYTGSTKGMIDWVRKNKPKRVVMVTECSMADNVKAELPDVEFVKPCNLCPHMKRITLPKILDSLVYLKEEVVIDPLIAAKARRSVERMIQLRN